MKEQPDRPAGQGQIRETHATFTVDVTVDWLARPPGTRRHRGLLSSHVHARAALCLGTTAPVGRKGADSHGSWV